MGPDFGSVRPRLRDPEKSRSHLERNGKLEGKLTVSYTGLEASQRRVEKRLADEAERKRFLEDEVRESIPASCEVDLTNQPDWKSSSSPLVGEFTLKIPGWVSGAGRRALFARGLVQRPRTALILRSRRSCTIESISNFRSERQDDIIIALPLAGRSRLRRNHKSSMPRRSSYSAGGKERRQYIALTRQAGCRYRAGSSKDYANLRQIFHIVRTGDEEQVILQPGGSTASN